MSTSAKASILIVDDDPKLRKTLSDILRAKGYAPIVAATGQAALARVEKEKYAAVLVDLKLPDIDGLEVVGEVKKRSPSTECIVITGYATQASAIEAINLGAYSYLQKPYDIEQLLVAIRRAAEKREAEETLRQSEERFRTLADFTYDWEYWAGPDGNYVHVSPSCERITGYRPDEFQREPGLLEAITHPDDRALVVRHLGEELESSGAQSIDFRIVAQSGEERWIEHICQPVYGTDGRYLGRRASNRDITERARAEEELKQTLAELADSQAAALNMMEDAEEARRAAERANKDLRKEIAERVRAEAELARSNAELEQFAYVVSHDLQEPLRKVQAFGDRLKTKYAPALDERGRDYLERMQDAARRMQAMINDLLTFSRVATRANPFVPVDLRQVVQEAVSDLEIRIEQTGGRVEIGPAAGSGQADLPTIEADPTQMRQLLENLIGNGLKFHREGVVPVVKVTSKVIKQREGELCQVLVEDNGIGFDEKYLDRIFQPFQRLHGRGKYAGTGIGLAICRKIAERHGGSIAAKSAPGRGATFIVTLPVSHSSQQLIKEK